MVKECLVCKKEFKTYPSKVRIGRGKYCSKKCSYVFSIGRHNSPNTEWVKGQLPSFYKGWRYSISRPGGKKYILLHKPDHPNSRRGYIRKHRYIMEQKIGRYLNNDEIVHHIDGNTLNNSIENLQLMKKTDHDRMNTILNVHKRWTDRRCCP